MRKSGLLVLLGLLLGIMATHAAGVRAYQEPAADVLTVTFASDPGDGTCDATCTLRDAILAANASPGPDRIVFAVGSGPVTIRPSVPLPFLEDPGTTIDGTTQPGYQGRPIVMLDGAQTPLASGLVATVADVEFRGLALGNFERYGLAAIGEEADGVRFFGNWVGMQLDGQSPAPNRLSGIAVLAGADNALVGGVCPGCGNRVAGNSTGPVSGRTGHGVLVGGRGTVGARIRANVIGIDVQGAALPNDDGVLIVDGAHATVGGRSAIERNVIGGNAVAGIEIRDVSFLTIRVEGNYVGVDESGVRAISNDVGIFVNGESGPVRVGDAVSTAGNVIAGNRVGVAIEQRASNITVEGNLIGLAANGATSLPNTEDGVSVVAGAQNIVIGGSGTGAGNQIVGSQTGVVIADAATHDVRVEGNTFGLARDGSDALGNGTGVAVTDAADVVIGGVLTAGNVIVGSTDSGIVLEDVRRATVRGNRIGLRADDSPRGNGAGVTVGDGSLDSLIQENRIGGNTGPGIQALGSNTRRNRLNRNVFLANGGLPIDLGGDGVSPNDPDDIDTGPNGLFNMPVIVEVTHTGVMGTVRGTASPRARVEVYLISPSGPPVVAPHPSGHGGGGELLALVQAAESGEWSVTLPMQPGAAVTALAVDAAGNTSEFARNFFPAPPVLLEVGFTPAGWFGPTTPIAEAAAPLGERLEALFRFDAVAHRWQIYRPGLPFLSDLLSLDPGDALWALLADGPRMAWAQPFLDDVDPRSVSLRAGLNFVTWTGPTLPAVDALAPLGDRVITAFRWDRTARRFTLVAPALPIPNTSTALQLRDILWLRVSVGITWQQPSASGSAGN